MIVINTMNDIRKVREEDRLSKVLVDELEQYFKDIVKNLTGAEGYENYNLENYGSIIVMESNDNPRRMDEIGMSEDDGGLLGAPIEFVTVIEIGGIEYYKIVIVCNNESAIVVYCAVGAFGEEFEEYIKEFVID